MPAIPIQFDLPPNFDDARTILITTPIIMPSLVALDIEAARRKLADLPWVENAQVRKVYPKTIEVTLKEREAFGIWQHGSELSLIEKSGSVIAP